MNYNDVLRYFPLEIGQAILIQLNLNDDDILEEIRFRSNNYIILKFNKKEVILERKVNIDEILVILQTLCENSIYSYQNEICEGFITIKGGHRVGITGSAVISNGKITNINYISSLNFRIARQIIGCSNSLYNNLIDFSNNNIYNTLIVSPPGAGKTTILRDLIRNISNGIDSIFEGKNVSVIDERGEIAAMYKGVAQNDLGIRTDIFNNVAKSVGMKLAIRSMAPEVIVADEIGSKEDVKAIDYAICCGVRGVFTAHGASLEDIKTNTEINKLIEKKIFERCILLDKSHNYKILVLNSKIPEYNY